MNVWLINHYAVPPQYYPLARTTNFAKQLMAMGHTVTIFCASSVHNSDQNLIEDGRLYREETVDGVHYVYVRCRTYEGNGIQRILNMLEFPRRLKKVVRQFVKPDALLTSSMTLQAAKCGIQLARQYGIRAVVEISDLWPESIVAYGIAGPRNPAVVMLRRLEKWIYKKADAVIFTMGGAYDYIIEQGWEREIPRSKVYYINNGIDLKQFRYNRDHDSIEDEDIQNPNLCKIVYTGSIRRVNNLGTLLDAAKQLTDPNVCFLIWGDGDERSLLEQRVIDEGITNVKFKGKVEKKYIPYIVSHADINLVHGGIQGQTLHRFGLSPNKMFDCLAAEKPIIMDMPANYNPVEQFGAGECVNGAMQISAAFARIQQLDKPAYQTMCENARRAAEYFDFAKLTRDLVDIFEQGRETK